ncbi:uncharacterized protein [Montipora foliosa]|uniref:uncharacterized protein n=1 Tax=Montipora foliosa TaxID=591990 RepID=UPI0035F17A6F
MADKGKEKGLATSLKHALFERDRRSKHSMDSSIEMKSWDCSDSDSYLERVPWSTDFQQDVEEVMNILSSSSLDNTPVKDKENNSHIRGAVNTSVKKLWSSDNDTDEEEVVEESPFKNDDPPSDPDEVDFCGSSPIFIRGQTASFAAEKNIHEPKSRRKPC